MGGGGVRTALCAPTHVPACLMLRQHAGRLCGRAGVGLGPMLPEGGVAGSVHAYARDWRMLHVHVRTCAHTSTHSPAALFYQVNSWDTGPLALYGYWRGLPRPHVTGPCGRCSDRVVTAVATATNPVATVATG